MEMTRESVLLLILSASSLLVLGGGGVLDLECHVNRCRIYINTYGGFVPF